MKYVILSDDLSIDGNHYICDSCKANLLKKTMPAMCAENGLKVSEKAFQLQHLTSMEKQLIKKDLPFLKLRELPKTRMDCVNDRIINIPISDDDVVKNVTQLPRTSENNGIINLKWKRRLKYKSYYRMEVVRPKETYEALLFLKDNHPEYKDIQLLPYEEFLQKMIPENDEDHENNDLECESSNDESETEEKEIDETESAFNSVTCLCPEDLASNVIVNTTAKSVKKKTSRKSSTVYEIAPGENKIPTYWARDPKFIIRAFATLWPDGLYGLDHPREKPLSVHQFYCQRMMHHSGIFPKEEDLLFVADQHSEQIAVENQINVSSQKGKLVHTEEGGQIVNCGDAFSIFKNLPGTPAYWKSFRNEILARIEQLEHFHFFFTLSCAESKWDEVIAAVCKKNGDKVTVKTDKDGRNIFTVNNTPMKEYKDTINNMSKFLKPYHFMITRMFDDRVKSFVKNILLKHKVAHYTYRVEFQVRGMPHIHGVFWLHKEDLKDYYVEDGTFDKTKVVTLIDKWISCSLKTGNPLLDQVVKEVNVHRHSKSCKKYGTNCRFNFPRLPSDETLIASPLPSDMPEDERTNKMSAAKDVLEKVRNALIELNDENDDKNLEEFLQNLDISYSEYKEALKISQKGDIIILKRRVKERNVNNYHECFILAHLANMDIQFCLDLHAVVTYITDYFSKEDEGLTKALREALKDKKQCSDLERLNYLKKVYFTHRQVNVCEATYRLINGLNLKGSNVKTKFVQTGFPENRSAFFRKVKPKVEGDESGDEEKEGNEAATQVTIPGRDGTFTQAIPIHEKYAERPTVLDKMCLAQFAISYETSKRPKKEELKKDESEAKQEVAIFGTDIMLPKYIFLQNGSVMKLRTTSSILRIHASSKKKGYEEIFAELQLFYPWRSEYEDLFCDDGEKCVELFNQVKETVASNKKSIFPHSQTISEIARFLENIEESRPQHLFDCLDASAIQENMDDAVNLQPLDQSELPSELVESSHQEKIIFKPISYESEATLIEMTRKLGPQQLLVLSTLIDFAKKTLVWESSDIDPPNIAMHGGGGVGKTFVIKLISQWFEKILRKAGDHPLKPKLCLFAPTGIAAHLIDGTTYQTGLGFKFGTKYLPLRDAKLEEFRKLFEDLNLIVLDEMSMLSSDRLYDIHRRMTEIFISKDPFGGIAMLVVGDLLQLPPVKGSKIHEKPYSKKNASLWNSDESLWANFDTITLEVNFRQGVSVWTECLNRLRVGTVTEEDERLLESRRLSLFPELDVSSASHVFYRNESVDEYNNAKLNSLDSDMVQIDAECIYPKGHRPKLTTHGTIEDTQFRKHLYLKKNARVKLTLNVNIGDSLVNGIFGRIIDFVYERNVVAAVIVAFDNPDIGALQRNNHQRLSSLYSDQNGTPIFRSTLEHSIKSTFGTKGKITQFPLKLAWASTGHGMQGITVQKGSNLIVHGDKKMKLPKNMLYVMLSRCSSIENVFLDDLVKLDEIRCDKSALEEKERIDKSSMYNKLRESHYDIFYVNIRSLECHKKDLTKDLYAQQSRYLCLTETWITPTENIEKTLMSKNLYHSSIGNGKGCCFLSPEGIDQEVKTNANPCFQMLSVLLQEGYTLVLLYISSKIDLQPVVTVLQEMLTDVSKTILIGDLNFDASEKNCLTRFLERRQFVQKVSKPTQTGGRIIDHVYVPKELENEIDITIMFKYYTDHASLLINLPK